MTEDGPVVVGEGALRQFCAASLVAAGARPDDADLVAQSLIDADLRGLDSHGVPARLPNYVARLRAGGIRTDAAVRTVSDRAAMVALDAADGFGQTAAQQAMTIAIERARDLTMAMVGVRNGNHLGALGYWSRMATAHGLVGFALSGARARIAPWGAAQPLLSTNPWSVAFPSDGHRPALVVDLSAGVVLSGALDVAAAAAEQIPLGWALDAAGRPTQDPRAGLAGSMLPFGGAKGGALTLAMEVLATVLTGGEASVRVPDLTDVAAPQRLGQLFVAFRADGFVTMDEFRAGLEELFGAVEAAPVAEGFEEVRVPGHRGERTRVRRRDEGIPLPNPGELEALAVDLGVPAPWRDQ